MNLTNLKQLFEDEDAVSPVIGVILMVAITVILAAVIGTFVLGLGENVQDSAPQANFQFEYDASAGASGFESGVTGETFTATHTGGEDVSDANLAIQIDGTDVTTSLTKSIGGDGTWSTGDSATFDDASGPDLAGSETVRVVWTSPSGSNSNTIGSSTVPS